MTSKLFSAAKSQRGQGWLGIMEIIDVLARLDLTSDQAEQLKQGMQLEFASLIFSGTIGCDEAALALACNECIESVIKLES